MEPLSGEGLVVIGFGEGVCCFERGQLEVNDGEGRLEERGASQGLGGEGPSLNPACCWLLPPEFVTPTSIFTVSLAFLGPCHTSHPWLPVLPSGPAPPVTGFLERLRLWVVSSPGVRGEED